MDQCSDGDAGVGIISCAFRGTEQDGRFIGGGFGATILDKGIARSLIARHSPTGPYANGHLMQMCDLFIHLFRFRICAEADAPDHILSTSWAEELQTARRRANLSKLGTDFISRAGLTLPARTALFAQH